jgi:DNA-binding GntR family transcriptional regulator
LRRAPSADNVAPVKDESETQRYVLSPEGSLTEKVYRALREEILSAKLGPEPIVEAAVAREFGVSKTPVREALQQLTHEGLLLVLPRKGYLVRPMGVSDIMEILDLRRILEPPLAAAAARNRTPAQVEQLKQMLERDISQADGVEETRESLREHEVIADLAGNGRAKSVVRSLLDETFRIPWLAPGLRLVRDNEHTEVLAAIVRGDADGAQQSMAVHLDTLKADTLFNLGAR